MVRLGVGDRKGLVNVENRPAAKGNLKERPVARLLQRIFRKKVTGALVVTDDSGDVTKVYLRDGAPVHVERPNDIDRLDNLLVERGLITLAQAFEANQVVNETGRRLGDVLIIKGLITRESLTEAIKVQTRRKLTRLFFARAGTYEIFTDTHQYGAGDEFLLMRIDPRCILFAGIRSAYDDARLRDELGPLAGNKLRLANITPAFLEAMEISPSDPVVEGLEKGWFKLEALDRMPRPTEARAVLLTLHYTDLLDAEPLTPVVEAIIEDDPLPPPRMTPPFGVATTGPQGRSSSAFVVAAPRNATPAVGIPVTRPLPAPERIFPAPVTRPKDPVSAAPESKSAEKPSGPKRLPTGSHPTLGGDAGVAAALIEMADKLDSLSHYEILGVPEKATSADVDAAYMRAARQYHPDRLASAGLRELMPQAERIMARVGEAAAVLTDPKKRAEYVANRAGAAGQPSARSVISAETAFQKGETFLKKNDHVRALECFDEAVKLNFAEPHYRAYQAWTRFDDPRSRKDSLSRETLATLDEVVRERPKFARGYYWMGQIWKHLNDLDRAEKAFREAAEQDKGFVDAEREVRLLEMRRTRAAATRTAPPTATANKTGGLFGKLFNKKED